MSKRGRRRYTDEFKADAVRWVEREGYGLTEAVRRLGVERSCLARWRREEVRKLRMERDILKKATAFFANESNGDIRSSRRRRRFTR